jgi:hypothetical protein
VRGELEVGIVDDRKGGFMSCSFISSDSDFKVEARFAFVNCCGEGG